MQTDRAMWDLVAEAQRLGIADLFDTEPEQIRDTLAKAGGNASVWLTTFDDFLKVYGWRTEGIADINIPSWIENPTSPLGQIRNFLVDGRAPRLRAGRRRRRRDERDAAIDAARSQLSGEALGAFDELLAINQVANFAWWNEDHNYYIDLRASIPMRRGALALGAACDADTLRRRAVPLLPGGASTWPLGARSGRTSSRWPPPATSTTTTTTTSARRCRRSSARCPTRSRTRS